MQIILSQQEYNSLIKQTEFNIENFHDIFISFLKDNSSDFKYLVYSVYTNSWGSGEFRETKAEELWIKFKTLVNETFEKPETIKKIKKHI